jgi:hypothetical protein
VTTPGPTPLDGEFTTTQLLWDVTSHAHPAGATTDTVTALPVTGKLTLAGEKDSAQETADPRSNFITNPVLAWELTVALED